eukprot:1356225-Ditylum_brightwellii.AAC.1
MQTFSTPISICNKTITRNGISLEYHHIVVLVIVLYNLGQLHAQIGEYKEAANFFHRALDLAKKWDSCLDGVWEVVDDACKGSTRLLAILLNLAHIQYHNGCYKEAMTTYTQELNVVRRTFAN